MDEIPDPQDARRDETLRRMLTTPRPAIKSARVPDTAKSRPGPSSPASEGKLAPTGEAS